VPILKTGLIYFAIVFCVGFLLGTLRVPFLVPAFGERIAEMIELPFMLAAIFFAARWVVHGYRLTVNLGLALLVGLVAAIVLLLVEFSVVLWLRGISIGEFLASRDPIAATLYYLAVAIFAILPAVFVIVARRRGTGPS